MLKKLSYNSVILSIGLVVAIALPFFVGRSLQAVAIITVMYALMATAWNFAGGYGSQVSFAQMIAFAIGAYMVAWSSLNSTVNVWVFVLLAMVLSAVIGFAIGSLLSQRRIEQFYFVVVTLALTEVMRGLVATRYDLGGLAGLQVPLEGYGLELLQFRNKVGFYWILLVALLITLAVIGLVLRRTMFGKSLLLVRDDRDYASSMGINVPRVNGLTLAFSFTVTAFAGAVYTQYLRFASPQVSLTLDINIVILLSVMVGGVATIAGPIYGAVIFIAGQEILSRTIGSGTNLNRFSEIAFAVLVLIVVGNFPHGLAGLQRRRRGLTQLDLARVDSDSGEQR
jgi:branched-chain amino acid transport system permease protein